MIDRIQTPGVTPLWSQPTTPSPAVTTTTPTTVTGAPQAAPAAVNGVQGTPLTAPQTFNLGPSTLLAAQEEIATETRPAPPMDGEAIYQAAAAEARYVLSMIENLGGVHAARASR